MAVALITTFYGSILANVFGIPIARKLTVRTQEEVMTREMIVEGILAIQAGENPRLVEERLKVFLPPKTRDELDKKRETE